jgi:hypothetical protein
VCRSRQLPETSFSRPRPSLILGRSEDRIWVPMARSPFETSHSRHHPSHILGWQKAQNAFTRLQVLLKYLFLHLTQDTVQATRRQKMRSNGYLTSSIIGFSTSTNSYVIPRRRLKMRSQGY